MASVIIAIVLLAASILLMIGAVIHNQLYPSYSTALTIPLVNIISIVMAALSIAASAVAYNTHRELKMAKPAMLWGIACIVILLFLFPLSEMGYLSKTF